MRTKKEHPADRYVREQTARAAYFTTCRRIAGGRYDTRRHETLDAARADVAEHGRAMIYAVTPEGFTIPLGAEARA
jgi:hypothetical protein